MGSIDGYIVRTTFGAFLMVLVSLTGVIWITQALRGIDLMTSQGQTILAFLGLTSLFIPALALVIMPLALMIAVAYVLNKLATDSEIIVMNAAGLQPWRLFRPFLTVTTIVSLVVVVLGFYVAPDCMRRLTRWDSEITGDAISNILRTGRFMQLDSGLTIFARERRANGELVGIFLDDRRNPAERVSIVADRGVVVKNETGSYLVLEDGNLERFEPGKTDPVLIKFERDAFDMSKFAKVTPTYNAPRERYFHELLWPDPNDDAYARNEGPYRVELHERLLGPLYPFAFVALTFAFLGAPRTTRQSRAFSMASTIMAVGSVRIAGFAIAVLSLKNPNVTYVQYVLIACVVLFSAYVMRNVVIMEPPAGLVESLNKLTERFSRRLAPS